MGNAEYMGPVSTTPDTMHLMILVSLAAAASAAPQIVPYEHVEIEAEPYIHIEPELTAEALGVIIRNNLPAAAPVAAPVQFAAPAVEEPQVAAPVVAATRQQFIPQQQFVPQQQFFAQQQFFPQQFAAPAVQAAFNGACVNHLGAAVPCSQ